MLTGKKPYLLILALGILVYIQSLFYSFTYLDDNVLILDNLYFLKDPGNIFKAFTQEVFHVLHASASYYRPILTISFMIDSWISGESPFFFHLSNVLIHLINCILVFVFLQKIRIKKSLAFVFALIFSVHPALSQAVSWVPGRNDSLLVLFVLPSFIFLVNFLESKKIKYFYWHILFFTLSLFSKESAIFIPILVMAYIYISYGWKRVVKLIPIFALGYFFIFCLWFFLRAIALTNSPLSYGLIDAIGNILKNSPAILLYLGKVLIPVNLTVLPTLVDSTIIYGIITLILIVISIVFSRKVNWIILFFGFIWFLIFLLSSFIRPINEYAPDFIEHRIYLPIIGLFIMLSEVKWLKNLDLKSKTTLALVASLVFVLSMVNVYHSRVFKDRISFWKDAVKYSPSHPLSHKNLGAMYYLEGDLDNAKVEFEKAAQLNPNEQMIYNNLGLIYYHAGDYDKAEELYKKELEINPNYDNAYFNWGLLLWQEGDEDKAAQMWERAVMINPDHRSALKALAVYYQETKNKLKADYYYQEAVKRGEVF